MAVEKAGSAAYIGPFALLNLWDAFIVEDEPSLGYFITVAMLSNARAELLKLEDKSKLLSAVIGLKSNFTAAPTSFMKLIEKAKNFVKETPDAYKAKVLYFLLSCDM